MTPSANDRARGRTNTDLFLHDRGLRFLPPTTGFSSRTPHGASDTFPPKTPRSPLLPRSGLGCLELLCQPPVPSSSPSEWVPPACFTWGHSWVAAPSSGSLHSLGQHSPSLLPKPWLADPSELHFPSEGGKRGGRESWAWPSGLCTVSLPCRRGEKQELGTGPYHSDPGSRRAQLSAARLRKVKHPVHRLSDTAFSVCKGT